MADRYRCTKPCRADKLGGQVPVAALVGNADGALLILAHHRLVFGSGDVFTRGLVMGEGFNGFGIRIANSIT